MNFPDTPGESWKVEVCVTCGTDRRNVNANVLVVNDGDVRVFDATGSNPNYADKAIEHPYCSCHPDVQRVTFVVLGEEVEYVIKRTAKNCHTDTDMRDQENLIEMSANWSERKRYQQRQSTNCNNASVPCWNFDPDSMLAFGNGRVQIDR